MSKKSRRCCAVGIIHRPLWRFVKTFRKGFFVFGRDGALPHPYTPKPSEITVNPIYKQSKIHSNKKKDRFNPEVVNDVPTKKKYVAPEIEVIPIEVQVPLLQQAAAVMMMPLIGSNGLVIVKFRLSRKTFFRQSFFAIISKIILVISKIIFFFVQIQQTTVIWKIRKRRRMIPS